MNAPSGRFRELTVRKSPPDAASWKMGPRVTGRPPYSFRRKRAHPARRPPHQSSWRVRTGLAPAPMQPRFSGHGGASPRSYSTFLRRNQDRVGEGEREPEDVGQLIVDRAGVHGIVRCSSSGREHYSTAGQCHSCASLTLHNSASLSRRCAEPSSTRTSRGACLALIPRFQIALAPIDICAARQKE